MQKESRTAIIKGIKGDTNFKSFLLSNGITTGTVFRYNYSPKYSKLINITINNRMVSIRENEFRQIEWEWKK